MKNLMHFLLAVAQWASFIGLMVAVLIGLQVMASSVFLGKLAVAWALIKSLYN